MKAISRLIYVLFGLCLLYAAIGSVALLASYSLPSARYLAAKELMKANGDASAELSPVMISSMQDLLLHKWPISPTVERSLPEDFSREFTNFYDLTLESKRDALLSLQALRHLSTEEYAPFVRTVSSPHWSLYSSPEIQAFAREASELERLGQAAQALRAKQRAVQPKLWNIAEEFSQKIGAALSQQAEDQENFFRYSEGFLEGLPRLVGVRSNVPRVELILLALSKSGSAVSSEAQLTTLITPFREQLAPLLSEYENLGSEREALKPRLREIEKLMSEKRRQVVKIITEQLSTSIQPSVAENLEPLAASKGLEL